MWVWRNTRRESLLPRTRFWIVSGLPTTRPEPGLADESLFDAFPQKLKSSILSVNHQLLLASRTSAGPQAADFFEAAQFEANRLFGGIIASDWSQCLCKCRYRPCGRYFIRAKLRRAYRHGTFCSHEHRNHASAVAVFTAQRSRAKLSLIELAAKWLVQQDRSSPWQGKVDSRRRLAAFLSMRVGQDRNLQSGRESVQLNWVTRNRAAIEKRRLELI